MKHTAPEQNYFPLNFNLHFTHLKMTLNSLHTSSEVSSFIMSLSMAALVPTKTVSTMTTMTAPVLTHMLKETRCVSTTMTFRKTHSTIQYKMHQPGTKRCQEERKDSETAK